MNFYSYFFLFIKNLFIKRYLLFIKNFFIGNYFKLLVTNNVKLLNILLIEIYIVNNNRFMILLIHFSNSNLL